jgi:recombination protein RecT
MDLRVGYTGKDYYRQENARDKPASIRYELVYDTDDFKPIKKSFGVEADSYEFVINKPFDRGEIIGGFGYIDFGPGNETKNTLIIVTKKDFNKSKNHAASKDFWDKHPTEMMFKTLVHRVTEKLPLDPRSVNAASYAHVEHQETSAEVSAYREIEENANGELIDADYVIGEVIDANDLNGGGDIKVDDSTGEVVDDPPSGASDPPSADGNGGQQSMFGNKAPF